MARINSFGASGIMTTSFDVNQCDYARKEVAYKMGQENGVVKLIFLALAPICVLLGGPAAQAQVSLDVSKITCDQFTGYKVTNPRNIALWLSGYYNGKRGNTVIDTQGLDANARKLQDYCLLNPSVPVMQATETLFRIEK